MPLSDINRLIPVLSYVLNQLVSRNDKIPLSQITITRFHAMKSPNIGIQHYLERFVEVYFFFIFEL